MENTANRIRQFIVNNFLFGDEKALPPDNASLLQRGLMDSTGVLDLVGFIEEDFGIAIANEEVVPENLDTIENLIRFVNSKLAVMAA